MKLLALRCPECNHSLRAENDHIVVTCEHCYTAVQIGDEGLAQPPVHWATSGSEIPVARWLPFWVFQGSVHIDRRETQGGRSQQADATRWWEQPRTLYVPAWDLPVRTVQKIGSDLIQRQPTFQAVSQPPQTHLTPANLGSGDAVKMLEFIVLDIEARRPDWLKQLDFRLEVGEPELWALPAEDVESAAP